jgi:hypothetical protein
MEGRAMRQQTLADGSFEKFRKMTRKERHSQFAGFDSQAATDFAVVSYVQINQARWIVLVSIISNCE